MTPDEFSAWLDRHFPGEGGVQRAADYLGRHKRTIERLRAGKSPVTGPTARKCDALERQQSYLAR